MGVLLRVFMFSPVGKAGVSSEHFDKTSRPWHYLVQFKDELDIIMKNKNDFSWYFF